MFSRRLDGNWVARNSDRPGYTLVEMLICTASMGVLMVGVSSAILLATQALDDGRNPSARIHWTGLTAAEILRDLAEATSVPERSATAITCTVPDRDGDDVDEIIRYAWSGTPGDAVMRQYNGGTAESVLEDVREFRLDYVLATPGSDDSAGESLLISYDSSKDLAGWGVSSQKWIGQYFRPSLPAEAASWSVTRVEFPAKIDGGSWGTTRVQIRPSSVGEVPSSTVLQEVVVAESSLGWSYTPWTMVAFTGVSRLAPGTGLCLVLKFGSDPVFGANSCRVRYRNSGASASGTHLVRTTNAGSSWSAPSNESMLLRVYGTITLSDGSAGGTTCQLSRVNMALRTGTDPSTRVDAGVHILNTPEVTVP